MPANIIMMPASAAETARIFLSRAAAGYGQAQVGISRAQFDGWGWAIDTTIPVRDTETEGTGRDRKDCTRQFRAA
jgi:hypothetical protein